MNRLRSIGIALAGVALVAGAAGSAARPIDGRPTAIPAPFAGDRWYPEYVEDMNWVAHATPYEQLATVRVKDAHTRWVNVVDGRRATWAPPACTCRRLRVWMYGGSTMFGMGQRDAHTIASELARAAWADGIALDVENRGVLGDTHWEEAQRFAWDLAGEPAPDLVIFYDGTNEVLATRFTTDFDRAPSVIPAEFWQEYVERVPYRTDRPADVAAPRTKVLPTMTATELGRAIGERYERSRVLSSTLAERAGVAAVFVWQPTSDLRPIVPGELHDPGLAFARRRTAGARAALGADVIDIADVFAKVREPLYYDTIHTNEAGARLVATAMYNRLRPRIDELVRKGGPTS